MNNTRLLKALGPIDIKSVHRDPMLRWLMIIPLFIALLIRWGIPLLSIELLERFSFDFRPYYNYFMSFILILIPILPGQVIGFLLLDQRDDQTLSALQVSPLTLRQYLIYRTTLPMILSVLITLLVFPVAGIIDIKFTHLFFTALSAALLAPIFALFMAIFANNKVQGFALIKAAGIVWYPPLFAYFASGPWELLFGIFPTYWPLKAFWVMQSGNMSLAFWGYIIFGILIQYLFLAIAIRKFRRKMT